MIIFQKRVKSTMNIYAIVNFVVIKQMLNAQQLAAFNLCILIMSHATYCYPYVTLDNALFLDSQLRIDNLTVKRKREIKIFPIST